MNPPREPYRILIVAVWFGDLPPWFDLWLRSCARNSTFDWLLVTDASLEEAVLPPNIHLAALTIDEFRLIIEEAAGTPVSLSRPYRVCECRPLFSTLLTLAPGNWDFWGHCDLDMVFGDLAAFITPPLLESYDRLFGQGHFSLYRNSEAANNFYRKTLPGLDYREVLAADASRGFDEHFGVNLLWKFYGGRFYEDESVTLDVDPHSGPIRRTAAERWVPNPRAQVFAFDRGRIVQVYTRGRKVRSRQFMYMHFQKRPARVDRATLEADVWCLTNRGFSVLGRLPDCRKELLCLNPVPLFPSPHEVVRRMRWRLRVLRRRVRQVG